MYKKLKDKHRQEFHNFPVAFAFGDEQFKKGMADLGLTPDQTDQVYSIGGGGFIRKSDSNNLSLMWKRHKEEMDKAMQDDDFLCDAFVYELNNHEYEYTDDVEDAINALGFSLDDIAKDERLFNNLCKARSQIREWRRKHEF
jgi:hypothetical protein